MSISSIISPQSNAIYNSAPMGQGAGAVKEDAININGSAGDDIIEISAGKGGSLEVSVNGETKTYSAEDARKLVINGGDGNDTITVDKKVKVGLTLMGGNGDDKIVGGSGNDTIIGGDGNNSLYGGAGDDTIIGGNGRDYIEGGHGDDKIYGNGGSDVIYAGKGNDYVEGGDGDDFINAGKGDDEVHGGAGNDVIFGLSGNDKLFGEEGDDTVIAGRGRDTVDGGEGFDTIRTTGSIFGHDTVLNPQDDEDVRKLNPTMVPLNFIIAGHESKAFKENMRDNLEAFAAIEPGQAMLRGIGLGLHPVVLMSTDDNNGYCQQLLPTGDAIITGSDSTMKAWRSIGSGSIVKINPEFIDFGAVENWSEQNTMVIMAHELCHAYNNSTGTMDESIYREFSGDFVRKSGGVFSDEYLPYGEIKGAELQAVGLYTDNILRPNPYGMTENDYRHYFHMPTRTGYTCHVEPKWHVAGENDNQSV